MKTKTNKIIAKEILILSGTLILIIMFYISLHIRNYYYNNIIKNRDSLISELIKEKGGFPKNRIWNLYHGGITDELIVNYEVKFDKYAIPKKEEKEFLSNFKNVKKLQNYTKRYSLFRDSIYMFDYVEFNEFKNLLTDSLYRNYFYDFASRKFDIGTKEEYIEKINEGLSYNENFKLKISENEKRTLIIQNEKYKAEQNILSNSSIFSKVLYFGLIIFILLYPIRFFIRLIIWSINTLKSK